MRIKYEDGKVLIDQTDYLRRILKRFGMINAKMAKLHSQPILQQHVGQQG